MKMITLHVPGFSGGKPLTERATEEIHFDLPCQLLGFGFVGQVRGTIEATSMTFFDADGNPTRAQIHNVVRSTQTNSVTGKTLQDDENFMTIVDFRTGEISLVGAVSRVHVQGQGIVIQDIGKITLVFDPDFRVIFQAGPP
jgi:hypothetical protein